MGGLSDEANPVSAVLNILSVNDCGNVPYIYSLISCVYNFVGKCKNIGYQETSSARS